MRLNTYRETEQGLGAPLLSCSFIFKSRGGDKGTGYLYTDYFEDISQALEDVQQQAKKSQTGSVVRDASCRIRRFKDAIMRVKLCDFKRTKNPMRLAGAEWPM